MDGAFPLEKLGTANRDLYLYGMSMLGCQSQTLWHFCGHFTVGKRSPDLRPRLLNGSLSRGIILQRILTVTTRTTANRPCATEQRLSFRWHRFNDFVAQVQPMPLCPN